MVSHFVILLLGRLVVASGHYEPLTWIRLVLLALVEVRWRLIDLAVFLCVFSDV